MNNTGVSGMSGCSGNASGITEWHCSPGADEYRLKPLGLFCWGGNCINNEMKNKTYHVHNSDKSFDMHLSEKEFKNVGSVYISFLRKQKMEKINSL